MHIGPGEINSNEIWEFVTKFAFDYAPKQGTIVGQIKGSIKVDTRSYLVIYDDQDFSWSHIYNNESLTCDFALLPRAKGGPLVNKYTLLPQKTNMVDIKITEHVRPRLWYFAIVTAKCDEHKKGKKALDLHNLHWLDDGKKSKELKLGKIYIDLTLLNTRQGYQQHFSFDEAGMLPITAMFLCVYVVLFAGQCCLQSRSQQKGEAPDAKFRGNPFRNGHKKEQPSPVGGKTQQFPLVKLWSILVMLELMSLVFRSMDLVFYAMSGEEATRWRWSRLLTLQVFSWATDIASQLGLALMVMLIAKGWTITANDIRDRSALMWFLFVVFLATVFMYIWAALDWDPASTLYVYESFPGSVVLVLRMVMFLWFLRSLLETYRLESIQERRTLYKIVAVVYSLWFLSLPLIVVCAYMLDPWYRSKAVSTLSCSVHVIALGAFGGLFWPSRAERYFKVHGGIQGVLGGKDDESASLLGRFEDDDGL